MRFRLITGLFLTLTAAGQPLSWSLRTTSGPAPTARLDGTVEYDPAGRQVFLFGGIDNSGLRNDFWSFSFDRQNWTEIQASNAPTARTYHTMVFDSARRRLLVFGGEGGGNRSDTWAYDIAAGTWRMLAPDGSGPPGRHAHSAIYDAAHDRMVVSHGFANTGRIDDTWSFDLKTNTWKNLTVASNKPLPRCLHHAAYDGARNRMYLYGGCSAGYGPCPQGDLWSLDLNTNAWTEHTPANPPPPRLSYSMAFDAARGKLVLYGGQADGLLDDTREFDPSTGAWAAPALNGAAPAARTRQEAAAAGEHGMVMFGGSTAATSLNELWTLSSSPQLSAAGVVNVFSGVGGAVAPGEDVSIYGGGLALASNGPGVSVGWNGLEAPVFYAGTDQLNVHVPYEIAGAAKATLSVTVAGRASTLEVPVAAVHPGVFPKVFNADGSANGPANPALRGGIVFFYATGQGVANPAAAGGFPEPVAAVGVNIASVLFKGLVPWGLGVLQVNARIAGDAPVGDAVPLIVSIGGVAAPSVAIAVK